MKKFAELSETCARHVKKVEADLLADVEISKFDRFYNRDQFNGMNKDALIRLEIHELFENDLIDYVVDEPNPDQATGYHETKDGKRVIVLDPRGTYQQWREVYDELTK